MEKPTVSNYEGTRLRDKAVAPVSNEPQFRGFAEAKPV
jgi:hypothetical protein